MSDAERAMAGNQAEPKPKVLSQFSNRSRWATFQLFGPIVGKELRVAARRKRTYWIRAIYRFVLLIVTTVAWFEAMTVMRFNRALGQIEIGHIAPTLLAGLGWFQLISLTLIAPLLTSASISEEHTRRTLGVLLTTPISPMQIAVGKLLSPTLQLLLLASLMLPVLAGVNYTEALISARY